MCVFFGDLYVKIHFHTTTRFYCLREQFIPPAGSKIKMWTQNLYMMWAEGQTQMASPNPCDHQTDQAEKDKERTIDPSIPISHHY
jgi:hypothetical protein